MKILLQHPHRSGEISGILSYCEELCGAVASTGIEVRVFASPSAGWLDAWRAVREVDLVHLNSHDFRLVVAGRLQRKPLLIKYHYPIWDDVIFDSPAPEGLVTRLGRTVTFSWHHCQRKGRIQYTVNRVLRACMRVVVANLVDVRLACSQFVARTANVRPHILVDYNLLKFTQPPASPHLPCQDQTFVYAGHLTRAKGPDMLLEAATILRNKGWTFRLDIAGGGPREEALSRQIAEHQLGNIIRLHGPLARPAVMALMGTALAVVVPSRWNDPAPYVILEAASVGTCAIGSLRGGIPELIGETGLLFDAGDVQQLARHMETLLRTPEEARRRGAAAYARARGMCDATEAAQRLVAVYEGLL
jgi:glycogen synthase